MAIMHRQVPMIQIIGNRSEFGFEMGMRMSVGEAGCVSIEAR